MADPIPMRIDPNAPLGRGTPAPPGGAPQATEGPEFKQYLLKSLEQVNQLQAEADAGVQRLVTGQSENVAEVFTAVRKADVAFTLLMEIRNKLLDAYQEIRQMRQ